MKNACEQWKDQLLDAVLTATTPKDLEEHLRSCANCSAALDEVRARKARLDALLPLVAQGAEPPANFRARVLAAAADPKERQRARPWPVWTLAGAAVLTAVALLISVTLSRRSAQIVPHEELAAAQKLAEWRAPSDGLLVTPGQEILKTMPRLGKSYLIVPEKTDEED